MCRRPIRERAGELDRAANELLGEELAGTWGGGAGDESDSDEDDDHWAPRLATLVDAEELGDARLGETIEANSAEVRRILVRARLGIPETELTDEERGVRDRARTRIRDAPAGPVPRRPSRRGLVPRRPPEEGYAGWPGALVENYDLVADADPVRALEDLTGSLRADPLVALPGEMDEMDEVTTALSRARDLDLPVEFIQALIRRMEQALFLRIVQELHPGALSPEDAEAVLVGGWEAIEDLAARYGRGELEPYRAETLRGREWRM